MRQFVRVGDEQSWIGRRFLADYWFGQGANCQHLAETRGRMAVCADHFSYDFGTLLNGHIYIPFLSAGIENRYSLRALLACSSLPDGDYPIYFGLTSRDAAGGNASDVQPSIEVTVGANSPRLFNYREGLLALPLTWPTDQLDILTCEIPTGDLGHRVSSTLPPGVRVLDIYWEWGAAGRPDVVVWLKSLYVIGFSEGVP